MDTVPLPPGLKRALPFLGNVELRAQETWLPELAFAVFIVLFLINIFKGRHSNQRRVLGWATRLISAESCLADNFSLIGPGGTGEGEVVVRENMHTFHVHASGRRFCKKLVATFYLRKRQNLLAWAISAATSTPDTLDIRITMQENAMPDLVLLIARKSAARSLVKQHADVKTFARALDVKREGWPTGDVSVYAEQASCFGELMSPALLQHSFGQGTWEELGSLFNYLHITSESQDAQEDDPKKVITLSLVLPEEHEYRKVLEWLRALMILIDSLGTFKFTPEQSKQAVKNRKEKDAVALKAADDKRQAEAAELKEKKAAEEQERLQRMTPQQREKELERKDRLRQRRMMNKYVKRM